MSAVPRQGTASYDASVRSRLVAEIQEHLIVAVPGSEVVLRGSLAEHRADSYSDIDLLWEVPDADFILAATGLPLTLSSVRSIASLRFDPDFQLSAKRRLAFVRFAGVPLFWRVDLAIFAESIGRDPDYDRDNLAARGNDWSLTESALMNVVAAVKAQRRGHPYLAAELLARGEERVGVKRAGNDVDARMIHIVTCIADQDSAVRPLADEILQLLEEGLSPR